MLWIIFTVDNQHFNSKSKKNLAEKQKSFYLYYVIHNTLKIKLPL